MENVTDYIDQLEKSQPLDEELQKFEQFQKQHQMIVNDIKESHQKALGHFNQLSSLFESVSKVRSAHKLSYEYLSSVLEKAREYLPPHLFQEIHRFSRAYAGGKRNISGELAKTLLEIEKRYPKPFSSPGGKDVWVPTLIKYTPEHKTYVEPYAGSASLFFSKEPSEKSVLSEVNKQIVDVYKFFQSASDADLKWLRDQKWDRSESHFQSLLNRGAKSLRDRVYKFKYLNLHSYRGSGKNFDKNPATQSTGRIFLANLEKFRDKLKGVSVLNQDALAVMRKYDGPNTFFYLDPPWKPVGRGEEWKNFDEEGFVKVVRELKGKVLLSYQGKLDLGPRFKSRSYTKNQFGSKEGNESRQTLYYNFNKLKKGDIEVGPDKLLALAALGQLDFIEKAEGEDTDPEGAEDTSPGDKKAAPKEPDHKDMNSSLKDFELSKIKKSEFRKEDDLLAWGKKRFPLQIEPQLDGSRLGIKKVGQDFHLFSEGSTSLPDFSELQDLLLTTDRDFILDGFVITKSGTVQDESSPVFMVSDILFLDRDLRDEPLSKRRHLLKNFFSGYLLGADYCELMPVREVKEEKKFRKALEWARDRKGSAGVVIKSSSESYGGECVSWEVGPAGNQGDSWKVGIRKVDEDKQIVYGVVLEPETEDAQGDRISADDIETAFMQYMKTSQTIGLNHEKVAKEVRIIEASIIRNDQKIFGEPVKKGSWWLALWVPDNLWPDVKSGKITGLSIGGTGVRTPVEPS